MANQIIEIGKTLAKLAHYSLAWHEALDGDAIEDIVNAFSKELNSLNGNEEQANSYPCSKCGEVYTEESGASKGFVCENCN